MQRTPARSRVFLIALIGCCTAFRLDAQVVRGRVLAPDSTREVPGVLVQLADSTGAVMARTLSRADGTFFLVAGRRGSFTIRTLRLGFKPSSYGPFLVGGEGRADLRVVLREVPVSIAAIHVTGDNECVRANGTSNGRDVLALWEEARKGLLAALVARSEATVHVRTTLYERVTSATGRTVHQVVMLRSGRSARPFISPLDPEAYATLGYREQDADGSTYRAPDADVLLSEGFAERHCLRLAESGVQDEAGVRFEPLPSAPRKRADERAFVDVEGTLWLDRATARLRRAEFTYTGVERELAEGGAGGALGFVYLPGDLPMVRSWSIRVPHFARMRPPEVWTFGGELSEVLRSDTLIWRAPGSSVRGTVRSGAGGPPAPGAQVTLEGTDYSAVADSSGAFAIEPLLAGRYELLVRSALATWLDVAPHRSGLVDARTADAVTVSVDAGSDDEAVRARCGRGAGQSLGAVVGDASALGAAAMHAVVAVLWYGELTVQAREIVSRKDGALVRPDSRGHFVVCGAPRDRSLDVVVARDSTLSEPIARTVAHIAADSSMTMVRMTRTMATRSRITGRVIAGTAASPVGDAIVDVVGGASTHTDSLGQFGVDADAGTVVLLRVRRIGYQPSITTVMVTGDGPTRVAVALTAAAVEIAGITVRADSSSSRLQDLAGFNARRRTGNGTFITADEIEKRRATRVEHLLSQLPGIQVDTAGVVRSDRGRTSLKGDNCEFGVQLFIDGAVVSGSYSLRSISPSVIRAIEVYRGAATTPPELRSMRSACGTVAIWTK